MATKKGRGRAAAGGGGGGGARAAAGAGGGGAAASGVSSPVEELLLAALERGGEGFETGRFLVTFKEGAGAAGLESLGAQGMRVADARDFDGQAASLEAAGDADAFVMPEIGVAVIGAAAAEERAMSGAAEVAADSPYESIDPERFVFATGEYDRLAAGLFGSAGEAEGGPSGPGEQLRSAARILEAIAREVYGTRQAPEVESEPGAAVLGATWGLTACKVPQSTRSGAGIKVAVLDTGVDFGHPDFVGRLPVAQSRTFVGQPVQDLHSHGTHCIGTACGPKAPAGTTPRYGVGHQTTIFVGKVLTNSGFSVDGSVLAGMNWAVANRCQVISMSLEGPGGPIPSYTAAGQAALSNGLLMIAAAGNRAALTGQPANSPTIMSVASLDQNLTPSSFSNFGKIEIAAPGRDVFSSVPRPTRYGVKSGTSMAAPHVAGCAALWAQTSASLRGTALWQRLRSSARPLPFPATRVGAGLVQAPA
ncbi:MAG TPA: S8 family serine peptidase [Pyrinomonadaceae bacterium]|jgi:subtilisin family serine protease